MRQKVNNSETHETKRYYEVPSEKVQEWSDTIADLTKQNQQFKAERDKLKDDVLAWAVTCKSLEKENKKLKAERDKFEQILNKECECGYKLEGQLHDMTKQRDTLIDDLPWYKAKVSRLEQRHSKLVDENIRLQNELYTMGLNQDEADDKTKKLERENRKLRVKSDSFFESWRFKSVMYTDLSKESDKYKSLLSEISQHIGNKPSSSTYKYFRAKLDNLNIMEDK